MVTVGFIGGKVAMQDGKVVRCPCCGTHASDCMGERLPDTLKLSVTFSLTGGVSNPDYSAEVLMEWSATACGESEGWRYVGGDTCIAPNLEIREAVLCCSGSSWSFAVALVNNGIQDNLISSSGIDAVTTQDEDPVYLTTKVASSTYDVPGTGDGQIRFYIEESDGVPPQCGFEGCSELPDDISVSYLVNGVIGDTITATRTGPSDTTYSSGEFVICDPSDGVNVIKGAFQIFYTSGNWHVEFDVIRYRFGVFFASLEWRGTFATGQVYDEFSVSCNSFNGNYDHNNTGGTGSPFSCGGNSFPFTGTPGTVPLSLNFS